MTSESYGKVLWHSWLPIVQNSIIDEWKARDDPESMVRLIEYWSPPLVPLWLHQHVLEQLVLPKIQTQVFMLRNAKKKQKIVLVLKYLFN